MKLPCIAILLLVAGASGCTALSPRVINGVQITPAAAEFIQTGITTRDVLLREFAQAHLGSPQHTWSRERAIAYTWQTTNGVNAGIHLFGKQLVEPAWSQQTEWAFVVSFDANDRVSRHSFVRESTPEKLQAAIENWVKSAPR